MHLFDALLEFNQKFWHGSGDTFCRVSWVELPPDFTLVLRQSIARHAIFTCTVWIGSGTENFCFHLWLCNFFTGNIILAWVTILANLHY